MVTIAIRGESSTCRWNVESIALVNDAAFCVADVFVQIRYEMQNTMRIRIYLEQAQLRTDLVTIFSIILAMNHVMKCIKR